jgi:hypothetical protein
VTVGDFRDRWVVPWSEVDEVGPDGVRLVHDRPADERLTTPVGADELLLVRDVLDCRVYLVRQRGVARVGDVWLERTPGRGMSVAGVEVGIRVMLRRLGLRRRSRDHDPLVLPLSEVHLVSGRGHVVQLGTSASPVPGLVPGELAHVLTHLPARSAADVVGRVPAARTPDTTERLHPHVRDHLGRAVEGRPASVRRYRRLAGWRLNRPSDEPPRRHQRRR